MRKLLIVDDEALVRIGMSSMLNYATLGLEIAGVASNGQEALEMIRETRPDIVITDVKMPVMDGLELVARCNAEIEPPPRFIVLTSFDDFDYARRALRENVSDYIIKVEINADILTDALKRAMQLTEQPLPPEEARQDVPQFFNKLLNPDFAAEGARYVAAALEPNTPGMLHLAQMTLGKIGKGYVVEYSETVLGIIFRLDGRCEPREACTQALTHIVELSRKYFSVSPCIAVGSPVETLSLISHSFDTARRQLEQEKHDGIVFCESGISTSGSSNRLVRAAQQYIREHIYERIILGDVAQSVNSSPNYLSTVFKKHAGMGFNDYVSMQKMELASALLKEGTLKVHQISEMLGFESSYYFSTVYKKYTGLSPSEIISQSGKESLL